MYRILRTAIVCASAILTASSTASAQIADHFDTSRRVTITGVFAGLFAEGSNSYLLIEARNAAGNNELWALQGDDISTLIGAGWRIAGGPPKFGEVVSATTFVLKAGAKAVIPSGAKTGVLAAATAGRLAHGIEVKLADGRTLAFGPAR